MLTIEEIEQKITKDYQKVPEVVKIYTHMDRYELHVTILTNNSMYNNQLMDTVLDIEYKLHNFRLVDDILLVVTYLPMSLKPNIHPAYKLIYEKEMDQVM